MESLHQTDCSDLRNRTHPIALRVYFTKVAWLFILVKKFYFNSWLIHLSSDCVIQMDSCIGISGAKLVNCIYRVPVSTFVPLIRPLCRDSCTTYYPIGQLTQCIIYRFTTTYDMLCNQYLSPLTLIRILLRRDVLDTTLSYVIKFVGD
jgi:hypothetical protein